MAGRGPGARLHLQYTRSRVQPGDLIPSFCRVFNKTRN